jgi:two-component system nitrogen regulation sensor histidine kinase NtrY
MSLRIKYWSIIIALHVVLIVLCYTLLFDKKWLFLCSEVILLASLYFSYLLYNALIRPISLMYMGSNAIRDRDFSVKFLHTGSKEMNNLIDIYNSMINTLGQERTTAEEQSIFLENLISISPVGIIILDFDGRIEILNKHAKQLLNQKSNPIGILLSEIMHPVISGILKIESGQSLIIKADGNKKYRCQVSNIVHKGFLRKFILIEDLTTELLNSEKDAYGKIIRMMAHEVNNSMGAVNSILTTVHQFGFEGADADPELKAGLETAIERNNNLTTFMKNYAQVIRVVPPFLQNIEISKYLRNAVRLWANICAEKNIILNVESLDQEMTLSLDPIQMEQVISNIIKNSIESIGADGEIRLGLLAGKKGFYIRDNGAGIDESTKDQLFSPFFSTKPYGQGVGLMLISEILQKHEAHFNLYSEGNWTSFEIWFDLNDKFVH